MAIELRSLYSDPYISLIATCLAEEASVDAKDFVAYVLADPWEAMTLKQRMMRLTSGLHHFLPGPFAEDIAVLKQLLPRISGDAQKYADMLSMFVPEFVLKDGFENIEGSLEALAYFTSHGTTSELAIRPFILHLPEEVMKQMQDWASHEHANIRRFASEGCRPRLPWAMALPRFKEDPSFILPILETLRADSSRFVQKSVANNLNDIAKDNPEIVLAFAQKWLCSHSTTDWIIKHGCRSLLKQGNLQALALFGSSPVDIKTSHFALESDTVIFGTSVEFSFNGEIVGTLPDNLRIEYAMDFMKANGKTARKVFKISEYRPTTAAIQINKAHKFIDYSTRKHYAGAHGIAILLNGREVAHRDFSLVM